MEETHILDEAQSSQKVYNETGIALGTFFGGPIATGYLFVANYKNLGKGHLSKKVWGITAVVFILYCTILFIIQEIVTINIPNVVFPIISVAIARQLFKQQQEKDVEAHIQQGGEVYSLWRAGGISFIFSLVMISIFMGGYLWYGSDRILPSTPSEEGWTVPPQEEPSSELTDPSSVVANLETRSYGEAAHVIVYNEVFFTKEKIDSIAEELTRLNFFDARNQKYIYLEKVLFDYEFSITDASANIEDKQTSLKYEQLRIDLEKFLKDGSVRVLLMDEDLEEVLGHFGEEI